MAATQRQKHSCSSCGAVYIDIGRVPLACPRCGALKELEEGAFPVELLRGVYWSFAQAAPPAADAFRATLLTYNQELEHPIALERLDVVLPTWRVRVVFIYRGDDAEALIEQKAPLSAITLLHQLHLSWARKLVKVDHHFFEGLSLLRGPQGIEPPIYSMALGS